MRYVKRKESVLAPAYVLPPTDPSTTHVIPSEVEESLLPL